jgi:pilus assembly protein Flp/PilA
MFPVDRRGATAIEYALIASIISIVILTAITSMTASLEGMFTSILAGFE